MADATNKILSGNAWQAASLRLTASPGVSMDAPAENWIQELTGQPPEQITRKRSGQIEAFGLIGTQKLILNVEPAKTEWQLRPAAEDFTDDNEIATLGEVPKAFDNFLELMSKWLDERTFEFNRIAFGCELMIPTEGHREGYELLSPYLHSVKIDPEGSSDFLYQINRTRESGIGIDGLRINRLSKWSVGKYVRMALLSNGQLIPISNDDRSFCRLELDINTSQSFTDTLPIYKVVPIFRELVDFAKEIASQGDIS